MSDERAMHNPLEMKHRPRGAGMSIRPHCMGCNAWKLQLGGRGQGVKWRCADCVEKRCMLASAALGVS